MNVDNNLTNDGKTAAIDLAITINKSIMEREKRMAALELRRGEMRQLRKQLNRAKKKAGVWKRKYRELAQDVAARDKLRLHEMLDSRSRDSVNKFLAAVNEVGQAPNVIVVRVGMSYTRVNMLVRLSSRPCGWDFADISIPRSPDSEKEVWISEASFENRTVYTFSYAQAVAFLQGRYVVRKANE